MADDDAEVEEEFFVGVTGLEAAASPAGVLVVAIAVAVSEEPLRTREGKEGPTLLASEVGTDVAEEEEEEEEEESEEEEEGNAPPTSPPPPTPPEAVPLLGVLDAAAAAAAVAAAAATALAFFIFSNSRVLSWHIHCTQDCIRVSIYPSWPVAPSGGTP